MSERRSPDPLAPVEVVVTVIFSLLVAVLLWVGVVAIAQLALNGDTDVSVWTIGDDEACALVSNEVVPHATDVRQGDIRRDVARLHSEELEVCLEDPTFWQKTAASLAPVGELVFALGSLLLILRVIRGGRRAGLFSEVMARRTRELGWFLLAMTLFWPFVAAAGRGVVVEAAVPDASWADPLLSPGVPVALVVVSVGILTVARVLRLAVPLQEEVDATI